MTTSTLFGQSAETVSGTGTGGPGTLGLHFTVSSSNTTMIRTKPPRMISAAINRLATQIVSVMEKPW